jgi:hypothetical protein
MDQLLTPPIHHGDITECDLFDEMVEEYDMTEAQSINLALALGMAFSFSIHLQDEESTWREDMDMDEDAYMDEDEFVHDEDENPFDYNWDSYFKNGDKDIDFGLIRKYVRKSITKKIPWSDFRGMEDGDVTLAIEGLIDHLEKKYSKMG